MYLYTICSLSSIQKYWPDLCFDVLNGIPSKISKHRVLILGETRHITYLETDLMKSREQRHLYFGASSKSADATCVTKPKPTNDVIYMKKNGMYIPMHIFNNFLY